MNPPDLTQAFEPTQEQIAQADKLSAIGQLAHGIAHELNTPLGVIISNLSVLKEYGDSLADFVRIALDAAAALERGEATPQVAASLRDAAKTADLDFILDDLPGLATDSSSSAQRMAAIVRSVAAFAQQSTDQLEPVDIEDAILAATTLTSNELKKHGPLVKHFAGVPPVLSQTGELTQVFVHLLLNAARALDGRPGAITLETRQEGGLVVVTVNDTGAGMNADQVAGMFSPFFSPAWAGDGFGPGLAVCHGIVTRRGGSISVESTLDLGTTITVRLPAVAATAVLEAA